MGAGLIWAITLGAVVTIMILAVIPIWIAIRFPDRAPHETVPGYLRQPGAPVLPLQREVPERGGAPVRTAA